MARKGSVVLDVALPADELDRAREALDDRRAGRAIRAALNQTANSARQTTTGVSAKVGGARATYARAAPGGQPDCGERGLG